MAKQSTFGKIIHLAKHGHHYRALWDCARFACWSVLLIATLLVFGKQACAADDSVIQLDRHVAAGQLADAVKIARTLHESAPTDVDPTLALARLARALQQAGRMDEAAEFYLGSVNASKQPAASSLAPSKIILVRLAATSILAQTGRFAEAVDAVAATLSADSPASDSQKRLAAKLCLQIGSSAFDVADHATAMKAYTIAIDHLASDDKAIAMLGAAWALALDGGQPVQAAKQLAAFVDIFPEHPDAPRASRACAACLNQAGREEDANAMLADLLRRWPNSQSAVEVVVNQPDAPLEVEKVAPSVRDWLLGPAVIEKMNSLDLKTVRIGLSLAAENESVDLWTAYLRQLAKIDTSGQATADLLQRFAESGKEADAERLAAMFIAPDGDLPLTPAAREAACRWAGRTQRWSMLTLASELESPATDIATRTASVERLFAEALMQTGRTSDAHRWWIHLVDQRGASDFATLLRCAETETSLGTDPALAAKRIDAARAVTDGNRFRLSLVDLLDAELAIRRMEFDKARDRLETVVRSSETDTSLRARAQWLIGETFYLQQDFEKAIEAYRRVEGIDSNGMWIAASLIQAGKSFEQLGRTRDAAVCYWGLVNRFAESPHAQMARRRLAAISPEQDSPNHSSNPILRR